MFLKSVAILALIFIIAVQAKYECRFTQRAKDCLIETKTEEDTFRRLMTVKGIAPEDNEIVQKMYDCTCRGFTTDTNKLIDKFADRMTEVFSNCLDGKRKLAKLLAEDCLDHCKDIKGDTKTKTCIKVMNCMMTRFHEFIDENE